MGKHHGWRVTKEPSGRHRGWAWDPAVEKYRTKTWDTEAQATAWASGKSIELASGSAAPVALPVEPAHMPTLRAIEFYLKRMELKGRSESHLVNVRGTLRKLAATVTDLAHPMAHRQVAEWLDGLSISRVGRHRTAKRKPSPGYRNRVKAEVQAFCRWLLKQEYVKEDPSRLLESAEVDHEMKAQFSVAEAVQLCAMPSPDPARQRRLALMLLAGLRTDEAAAVTWGDVLGGMIYVRKHAGYRLKRKKERLVPVQPALAGILGQPGHAKERIAPLPGNTTTVQHGRHFRAYLSAIGMEASDRTPHSCRHTYGAVMTATGAPSIMVQQFMGHSSMQTTSDYAEAAPLHVQAVKGWQLGVLKVAYGVDGSVDFLPDEDKAKAETA